MINRKVYISFKIELSEFDLSKTRKILNAISAYAPVKDSSTNSIWSSSFIGGIVEGQDPVKGNAVTYLYNDDTMMNLFQRITDAATKANEGLLKLKFDGGLLNGTRYYFVANQTPWVSSDPGCSFHL
tara:strand:+ start:1999 stop:2379 length:381 start_codon:yes stop_codon:yes gene_type:complete